MILDEPEGLSVFREISNAVIGGLLRGSTFDFMPLNPDGSRIKAIDACNSPAEFGLACAHQAGDTEYLAFLNRKTNAVEMTLLGQIFDLQGIVG